MKLSVIIPFHAELELIGRAINSVLVNTNSIELLEIFICNDGPIAESEIRSKLSPNGNQVTTVLRNQYARGPGGARNTGLDVCSGECIAFLDADDFWLVGKIEAQMAAINDGASFVATAYRHDVSKANVFPPLFINKPMDVFMHRGIGTSTVMISRQLIGDRRFSDIRFAQDIDYWYNLSCDPKFRYASVSECLVVYNTSGSTSNKFVQLRYLIKVLVMNKIGLFSSCRILIGYIVHGVYKHYLQNYFR